MNNNITKILDYFKRNNNFFKALTIILILVIVFSALISYNQYNNHLKNIEKIVLQTDSNKKLETLLEDISIKKDSLQIYGNKDYYLLSKDILTTRKELANLKVEVDKKYKGWLSYFANFWGILGLLLGTLTVFISFKEMLKNEVEKNVVKKIAVVNNISKEIVERVYFTEKENSLLRNEAKVLLINEKGTGIDSWLDKIFRKGSDLSKFNTTCRAITNFDTINDLKDFTLIVIDNTKSKNRKKWNVFADYDNNLTEIGDELINFCDRALKSGIAILYFSEDVNFPTRSSEFSALTNKGLLAYGKVHSKIYPNAMDVLKNQKLFK